MDEQREELVRRLEELASAAGDMKYYDLAAVLFVIAGAAHDSPTALSSLGGTMIKWASNRLNQMGGD
jgi:hypothetical protein